MKSTESNSCCCRNDNTDCSGAIIDAWSEDDIFDPKYSYKINATHYEFSAARCTSKADCLLDRLNLKRSLVLLICQKHYLDYTSNYTPNGYRRKGKNKTPLCSLCPGEQVAFRQVRHSTIDIFKKHWSENTVIGTPVCRRCYDGCVERSRIEELQDETPPHSQPATEIVTDADGVTTVYSQEGLVRSSQQNCHGNKLDVIEDDPSHKTEPIDDPDSSEESSSDNSYYSDDVILQTADRSRAEAQAEFNAFAKRHNIKPIHHTRDVLRVQPATLQKYVGELTSTLTSVTQLTCDDEFTTASLLELVADRLLAKPTNYTQQMGALHKSMQVALTNHTKSRAKRALHSIICKNMSFIAVKTLFPSINKVTSQNNDIYP